MSDEITVTSTTDAPEAVVAAAGETEGETPKPSEASEAAPAAAGAESAGEPETPEKSQEQESEADADADTHKRKGGYQRRIDRLTREKRQLEARVAALEGKAGGKPPGEKPPEEPADKPAETKAAGEPKPEDFQTYEEYTQKAIAWALEQRDKQRLEQQRTSEAEQQEQALLDGWKQRADEARKAHPDYDDVLGEADDEIPGHIEQALLESERGPELAYHLAKNPAELERILKLSAASAVRELGKIEATLSPASPPPKPKASSAPAPIPPLRGSGAPAPNPEEMSFRDFKRWRERGG